MASACRQNFSEAAEGAVNDQINMVRPVGLPSSPSPLTVQELDQFAMPFHDDI